MLKMLLSSKQSFNHYLTLVNGEAPGRDFEEMFQEIGLPPYVYSFGERLIACLDMFV